MSQSLCGDGDGQEIASGRNAVLPTEERQLPVELGHGCGSIFARGRK